MPLIGWFYDSGAPHRGDWIIFGAGALGISAHAQIARADGQVIAYVDNAHDKQGKTLLGAEIHPATALPELLQPGINLVVACDQYAPVVEQLAACNIDWIWIGIADHPLDIPETLKLDDRTEVDTEVLVYLPAEALAKETLHDYLDNLAETFGKPAEQLACAVPSGWERTYATLGLPDNLPTQDIVQDARRARALVFFRDDYHADQWTWSPHGLSLLTPRLYVLHPWGQLRCTNRIVTTREHHQIGKHPFFRNTTHDNQSFLVFAPHIQLARNESFGIADEFGFRHPSHSDPDAQAQTTNVCLFGGSAAWGQGLHDRDTLANRLQKALNELPSQSPRRFRVFNFSQPAATVMSQIIAFLLYGVAVRPHIVIAHDGFNDLYHGQQNDRHMLRAARYIYHPMLEQWSALLHGAPPARTRSAPLPPSPQQVVSTYIFRREQFAKITAAYGCRHIHGLQPYLDSRPASNGPREAAYRRSRLYGTQENRNIRKLYDLLKQSPPETPWIDFDAFFRTMESTHDYFFDIVHPTAEGNARMADHYAQLIATMTLPHA